MKFVIYGKAVPQGSSRAFVVKGRAVVTAANNKKLKPWRQEMTASLMAQCTSRPLYPDEAVAMTLTFVLVKPPSVKKRVCPNVKPDVDKLVRAVLDSATGVLYRDDAQVCRLIVTKVYGRVERVELDVSRFDGINEYQFVDDPLA